MPGPEALFDELYRDLILEYYRSPKNRGSLPQPTHRAEGLNPTCGDEITIEVKLDGNTIEELTFDGQGCSISQASAAMLGELVTGKPVDDALHIAHRFEDMVLRGEEPDPVIGDLEAFQGVAKFHARVKCATLAAKVLADCVESPVNAKAGG